jgi:hypothetical protein
MNKIILSTILLILVLTTAATATPIALAEKSKSGSPEYQQGYRDGAVQAEANINKANGT